MSRDYRQRGAGWCTPSRVQKSGGRTLYRGRKRARPPPPHPRGVLFAWTPWAVAANLGVKRSILSKWEWMPDEVSV